MYVNTGYLGFIEVNDFKYGWGRRKKKSLGGGADKLKPTL